MTTKLFTIKKYATRCGISTQSAHKRIKRPERYPEILKVRKFNDNFFLLEINTSKGFTKKCNDIAKIIRK